MATLTGEQPEFRIYSRNWENFISSIDDDLIYSIALLLTKSDISFIEIDKLAVITTKSKKPIDKIGSMCKIHVGSNADVKSEHIWNLFSRNILKEYYIEDGNKTIFNNYFSINYMMKNFFKKNPTKSKIIKHEDVKKELNNNFYEGAFYKMVNIARVNLL